ncbi:MAG: AI-2E family transporter [Gammaproteobacteria bacterium]|nr:AI-2E family transporter [Gammaproteobacteria bacterium]
MNQDRVNKIVLVIIVVAISALFLSMIHQFLMAIFLAGLFSALARPVYRRLRILFRGHRHAASATTLLMMVVVVLIPLLFLVGIVVGQAVDVGQTAAPWIKRNLEQPDQITAWLQGLPIYEYVEPYRGVILQKAGQVVNSISNMVAGGLSQVTLGTANFLFMTFVFLYTMYFLQMDGDKLVRKILYYLPLNGDDESLMLDKFTSVTRAMIKGTLLIGILQGTLAGIAFAVAGFGNAVFWGTVMAVLSIIPSVGSALVWIPASIILIMQGNVGAGVGLLAFCGLIVGSLDNVLRPILVGKDTRMHELMIFFGTLGGILMFGIPGVLIGPVVASLFITVWELYGIAFSDYLPEVHFGRQPVDRADTDDSSDDRDAPGPPPGPGASP